MLNIIFILFSLLFVIILPLKQIEVQLVPTVVGVNDAYFSKQQ